MTITVQAAQSYQQTIASLNVPYKLSFIINTSPSLANLYLIVRTNSSNIPQNTQVSPIVPITGPTTTQPTFPTPTICYGPVNGGSNGFYTANASTLVATSSLPGIALDGTNVTIVENKIGIISIQIGSIQTNFAASGPFIGTTNQNRKIEMIFAGSASQVYTIDITEITVGRKVTFNNL